jgi:hypothetical protein
VRRGMTCECGNERSEHAACCTRCRDLDGAKEFDVLQELRAASAPVSVQELAAETGRDVRSLVRTMRTLERSGRVRRYLVDAWSPAGERETAVYVLRR